MRIAKPFQSVIPYHSSREVIDHLSEMCIGIFLCGERSSLLPSMSCPGLGYVPFQFGYSSNRRRLTM